MPVYEQFRVKRKGKNELTVGLTKPAVYRSERAWVYRTHRGRELLLKIVSVHHFNVARVPVVRVCEDVYFRTCTDGTEMYAKRLYK